MTNRATSQCHLFIICAPIRHQGRCSISSALLTHADVTEVSTHKFRTISMGGNSANAMGKIASKAGRATADFVMRTAVQNSSTVAAG